MAELTGDPTVTCYDRHAQAYDLYQSTVVPGYPELLDLVAKACQRFLPPEPRIIDLGCGTGNASLAILKRIPARIYLIDGSERMTGIGPIRTLSWDLRWQTSLEMIGTRGKERGHTKQ